MASTARHEREMVLNARKDYSSTAEPLEKLRLQCLQRGVTGIRDFGRQVALIYRWPTSMFLVI